MGSWWDSLEAVSRFNTRLQWVGAGLTILAAMSGVMIIVVGTRMETLKDRRTADRRLTPEQRAGIKQALEANPVKGRMVIVSMDGNAESYRYAADFVEVLEDAGWTSRVRPILRLSEGPPPTGVILAMENPQAIPEYVNPLFKAIKNAGVPVEAQTVNRLVENEPITLVIAFKP